jgi:hypothetical protein
LDAPVYTPTQKRILAVLADGNMHLRVELEACIDDELADKDIGLRMHLSRLRVKLRPSGLDVIYRCVNKKHYYQKVRLIAAAG